MTDDQRKDLLNLCELLGDPYASMADHDGADAIRAALATIDEQENTIDTVNAALRAQAEELELLRRAARYPGDREAWRKWEAKYGGAK